ncbi:MAG: hypothetical protein HY883_05865 [Deltaproteobacteria bacterium]|nr:hypothetical protein [Deltaproteobacteria bacterium]
MKQGAGKFLKDTLSLLMARYGAFPVYAVSLSFILFLFTSQGVAAAANNNGSNGNNGIAGPVVLKTAAVLPLENLTENPLAAEVIRDYIKQELKEKGVISVADDAAIEEFLSARRIRYTGAITKAAVREMGKILGADAVLVGSVNYYSQIRNNLVAGVACRLVSTADGNIIWAENLTYTGRDFEGIFGLGTVKSLERLASMVVKDIIGSIADRFFMRENAISPFEIERVIIYPVIGKAGEKRELRVKFLPIADEPEEVRASMNGTEIILSKTGKYEYAGSYDAPAEEGTYLVDVTVQGESSMPVTFNAAAEVAVDNTPPNIGMALNKSIFSTARSGNVMLEPKLMNVDSIEEWNVDITNNEGIVIRSDRGYGSIPRKMVWRGESDARQTVGDGNYTISLTVRDEAGNVSKVSNAVRVKNAPPVINVAVDIVDNVVLFVFDYDKEERLRGWQFSIVDKDGNTLKKVQGEGSAIPDKLEYPLSAANDIKNLSFTVVADDVAGNQFRLTKAIPSLFNRKIPFAGLKGKDQLWQDF